MSDTAYSYRNDPNVPDFRDEKPIIVFDGHCVLCSRWANFVIKHDKNKQFRLLAAQSDLGETLYAHYGIKSGARPGIGAVTLEDYRTEFKTLRIKEGFHDADLNGSVYERILGSAYDNLPDSIQALHRPGNSATYQGRADIVQGKNPIAKLLCMIFRFPKAGLNIPLDVTFTVKNGREHWVRNFDDRKMHSTQERGTGRYEHLMTERFGPIAIGIALVVKDKQLHNITQSWSVFGVTLPRVLCPGGEVYEHEEEGRFNFHVDIKAPLIGRIVKYKGWLEPP